MPGKRAERKKKAQSVQEDPLGDTPSKVLLDALEDGNSPADHVNELVEAVAATGQLKQKFLSILLGLSCSRDRIDVTGILLEKGADANARTGDGRTMLSLATSGAMVYLLLRHGADINARDSFDRTALMLAMTDDKDSILLKREMKVEETCGDSATARIGSRREAITRALIDGRADLNARDKDGSTALMYALKLEQSSSIVHLLIAKGADMRGADKRGRTVLHIAACKDHISVVNLLVDHNIDVNAVDERGWNVVHQLAVDKERSKKPVVAQHGTAAIMHILIRARAAVHARDKVDRTPLHWAAVTGNAWLARILIENCGAEVHATDRRMKTPLHLAAANSRVEVAEYLLHHRSDVHRESDGGWTPLHNACEGALRTSDNTTQTEKQSLIIPDAQKLAKFAKKARRANDPDKRDKLEQEAHEVERAAREEADRNSNADALATARMLLEKGADINCKTHGGKTPLHVAAEAGSTAMVKYLLGHDGIKRNARDSFGNTALTCAAKLRFRGIVREFHPKKHSGRLSPEGERAARGFNATCVDYGNFKQTRQGKTKPKMFDSLYESDTKGGRTKRVSLFDLLYGDELVLPDSQTKSNTVHSEDDAGFRWIHIPANNLAWCHELLTKWFVERDGNDLESFRSLERSFNHQHRGQKAHSQYMRPVCEIVPRFSSDPGARRATSVPQPVQRTMTQLSDPDSAITQDQSFSAASTSSGATIVGQTKLLSRQSTTLQDIATAPLRVNSTISDGLKNRDHATTPTANSVRSQHSAEHSVYLFMPYLHFENDGERLEMQRLVNETWAKRHVFSPKALRYQDEHLDPKRGCDESLIFAHLNTSSTALHIRRTLDQSFYRNIDTTNRDADQVIWRYQDRLSKDAGSEYSSDHFKILMVDQLWLWIIGNDLIVTSFPQRWRQPRNDPHNILDTIIAATNAPSRARVQNVYELATIIANCCSASFSRHGQGSDETPFLDMFEASIGNAMDEETRLFNDFRVASDLASQWLRHTRQPRQRTRKHKPAPASGDGDESSELRLGDTVEEPAFVDTLLDVGPETHLLREIKDIHDELDMLEMCFGHQKKLVPVMKKAILRINEQDGKKSRAHQAKIDKGFEEQQRNIDHSLRDIERMTKQVQRIYDSITKLLDLKQKHANAIEARYASKQAADTANQATETARQGKTLMVFTIVTVIFLPLSFIAAFFAINIADFRRGADQAMTLAYVSRYVFGVGLSVAMLCVIMAIFFDKLADYVKESVKVFSESKSAEIISSRAPTSRSRPIGRGQQGSAMPVRNGVSGMADVSKLRSRGSARHKDLEQGDVDDRASGVEDMVR